MRSDIKGRPKKLLIVVNVDWIFMSHRVAIAKEAIKQGFEVYVAAKDTGRSVDIAALGIRFLNLPVSRAGTSPFTELKLLLYMYRLYQKVHPDIVYHVTMKPVIYGSLVARILRIRTVNAISGLGYHFTAGRRGLVQQVMIYMMKMGFSKKNNHLIFENKDDCNELRMLKVIHSRNRFTITKGVGVDLKKFNTQPFIIKPKQVVLLATRMLWDKGVKEFIAAALLLREKYDGKVSFKLCGMSDIDHKMGIEEAVLVACEVPGYLEWLGHREDMVAEYKDADVVVLPSYREGKPVVLLEACASGKPIVTTHAIGCRDCVEEGLNGYKVPVKSVEQLAEAIEKLLDSAEDRIKMGVYSRKKAEREFDQQTVVKIHMEIFYELLGKKTLRNWVLSVGN